MNSTSGLRTTAATLTDAAVETYRQTGFVHLPGVISADQVARCRDAALRIQEVGVDNSGGPIFKQLLQVWKQDDDLRELTLNKNLAAIAAKLAGTPLRLWHDQLLIKAAHNGAATEFHQDQPYWPHARSRHALSAWVALVDVPVERGCMTFIPGSHMISGLRPQDLSDAGDLFRLVPDLAWNQRVTVPLRAGDCTFHNAYLAHTAAPNLTDDPRIAHVIIYVDADVAYSGGPHVVTDPLRLTVGQQLPNAEFPPVG